MKRRDILRRLAEAGYTFEEGANHTKAYDKDGNFKTTVGRHTDIKENVVKKIEKQTSVKLL